MQKLVMALLLLSTALYARDGEFTDRFEKRSVFGKWIDIDKGKIIDINSKTKFSFESLDNDLIILRNGSKKNYLKRIGTAKTKIKGRIVQDVGAKAFASVANTAVTLTHVKDSTITTTIKTNSLGYFSDATLPSGEYYLRVRKREAYLKVPVSLINKSEALGTFVLTHQRSAVFKSKLSMNGTFVISNGKRHKAFVDIFNYGNKKGRVCYSASLDDKDLKELRFARSCKLIPAGKSIKLPVYFIFDPIAINSTYKELKIKMKDKRGHTIVEAHPFKVYKNFFNLKIKTANKAMKAYVVLPEHEVKTVNIKKGSISLPKLSDEEYKLILANSDPKQKTAYVVDIGAEEKLIRGEKKKKSVRRHSKKNKTFFLKQSISRYPDIGDIALYAFMIPDSIVMQEDDAPLRVRFSKQDRMGEAVDYAATIGNNALATVSYSKGYLTVKPRRGKSGVTTITLKNVKRYGRAKKKLFTLYIKEVNNRPRIISKPVVTALENKTYSYYLKGVDAETKHLSAKALKLPKWLKFNKKRAHLTGKPQSWNAGDHTVLLRLSDGTHRVDQRFVIKVIALDKAPESKNAFFTVLEDKVLSEKITAKVRKGQKLSFSLVSKPKNGTLVLDQTGSFTYRPEKNYYGNDSFKVKALSSGKSTESVININIVGVNDAPTARDIIEDEIGSGPLEVDWMEASQAKDVDQDTLTLGVDKPAKLGTLTINEEGKIIYIPHADTRGEELVYLTVSDGNGAKATITLTLSGISRQLTPRVLQTGQKVIYHPHGDAIYKKSLLRSYELDLAGRVVKDRVLKKTWYVGETVEKMSFEDAHNYCENLQIGIVNNWRLPTIKELVMLTDKGRITSAIDPIFEKIKSDYYWSSTLYGKRKGHRWTLYFDYGNDYFSHEKKRQNVLCMREGINFLHESDFTPEMLMAAKKEAQALENGEAIKQNTSTELLEQTKLVHLKDRDLVWDKEHELIWEDREHSETATWVAAIKRCEKLTFYGRSNWRLPNFNELYTITDYSDNNRSVPNLNSAFKHVYSKPYWTSTTGDNDHDRAWGISFQNGSDFSYDKTEQIHVRCVRDQ